MARVMPQDGTHQILQLKCPRSGIWGAAGEWGSVLTYCPDSARAGNEQTRVAEHVLKDRSGVELLFDQLSDDHSLVSLGVSRAVQQGQWSLAGQLDQLLRKLLLFRSSEFGAVVAPELVPTLGPVPEPGA